MGVAAGGVAHGDAALLGRGQIQPVHAHAGAAHHFAAVELRDDLAGEREGAVEDHAVGAAPRLCQLLIVGGLGEHQLRVGLIKDGLDEADGNVVAAAIDHAELGHPYAPQPEHLRRVVPQDLATGFLRQLFVGAQGAHGEIRPLVDAVAVGIVRGHGQAIIAQVLDEARHQLFPGLAAYPALPVKVEAGFFRSGLGRPMGLVLPVLIHALQPVRHPAAAGLQVGHLEFGKPLQHAVGAEAQAREHLLHRMAGHVAAELAVAVTARLLQHRARALVDADRHAQILGRFVDGIVVGTRQGAAAELVGAPEDPHQAEFLTGVTQLLDGPGRVLQGQQHDAPQPRVIVAAILREPGVVGTADGRAQLGVDVRAPHDVEAHGREQDAEIDPLPVHVADVRRGIETRGDGFRKRIAPRLVGGEDEPVIGDLAVGPPFGVRDGLAVDVAAGLVRSGDLHPPAELLRHVPVIKIRRLHNMPIRIDDTKSVLHGSTPSSGRGRAPSLPCRRRCASRPPDGRV